MKEELVKQMNIDLQRVSDYDIELNEFAGWEACPHVNIHYDTMAKELIDRGWAKQIWHKVADGDLPKDCQEVRFVGDTGNHHNGVYVKARNAFYKDGDIKYDIYEVIAWTGLPIYKE